MACYRKGKSVPGCGRHGILQCWSEWLFWFVGRIWYSFGMSFWPIQRLLRMGCKGRGLWGFLMIVTVGTGQHRTCRLVFVGHGGVIFVIVLFLIRFS